METIWGESTPKCYEMGLTPCDLEDSCKNVGNPLFLY